MRTKRLERLALTIGAALFALVSAVAIFAPELAGAQQEHKIGSGNVQIENDTERRLFYSLICTCGCPRETLGTCACDFAHERRAELRHLLGEGKSIEQIHQIYVNRFGTAVLAVPKSRATFLVPLGLIAIGTGVVVLGLRTWRGRGEAARPAPAKGKGGKAKKPAPRDAYDEQLDDELRRMDE